MVRRRGPRFADALRGKPAPAPDRGHPAAPRPGRAASGPPNLIGRRQALAELRAAGGDRVAVYGIENHAGTPVYVHAKVVRRGRRVGLGRLGQLQPAVLDPRLGAVLRRLDDRRDEREPTVLDRFGDGARVFARDLRLELRREHLDRAPGDDADLLDPAQRLRRVRRSAADPGGLAPRRRPAAPPGRLRPLLDPDPARPPGAGPPALPPDLRPGRPPRLRCAAGTPSSAPSPPLGQLVSGRSSALPDPPGSPRTGTNLRRGHRAGVVSRYRSTCSGTQRPPRSHRAACGPTSIGVGRGDDGPPRDRCP